MLCGGAGEQPVTISRSGTWGFRIWEKGANNKHTRLHMFYINVCFAVFKSPASQDTVYPL
jgi:hypothetical protein